MVFEYQPNTPPINIYYIYVDHLLHFILNTLQLVLDRKRVTNEMPLYSSPVRHHPTNHRRHAPHLRVPHHPDPRNRPNNHRDLLLHSTIPGHQPASSYRSVGRRYYVLNVDVRVAGSHCSLDAITWIDYLSVKFVFLTSCFSSFIFKDARSVS